MNLSSRFNSIFLILTLCLVFPLCMNGQAPPVPDAYQPIYTLDQNYLQSFMSGTLNPGGALPPYTGMQCGHLKAADSNAGPSLLSSNPTQQLLALQALGVPCIEVHLSFPLLYEPFMTSQGQSMAAFQSYYSNLAQQIHGMGLKLMVESTVLFTSALTSQAGWDTAGFYATLDWSTYQQARAQTALTIAQTMQPDYMVVLEEPDTEAMNSGQAEANTPDGSNALLSQILASLQDERAAGMKIGAGAGTWLPNFQSFISEYVTQPMDFLDMHIYPVNNNATGGNYLSNALAFASTAASVHMPMSMTECWLHKELDSEVPVLTPDQVSSRDVFSFFAPLDQLFLQTMQELASYIQVTDGIQFYFINPFASSYYFAYLTYDDTTSAESPADLISAENSAVAAANQNALYASTGIALYNAVLQTPDTTPPAPPPSVWVSSGNPTTALITWYQGTDNVGVAGYYVLRDGSPTGTTAQMIPGSSPVTLFFQDSGLAEASTHTYTVEAFDLANNVSQPSQPVNVTTTDVTPPTPPGNLAATALACTYVKLTWTASQDNTQISNYKIYMGSTPSNMIQIGTMPGNMTTYSDQSVNPATTYYFGVAAADSGGNLSYMSTPVAITTPALPNPPATVTATANSATNIVVTWSAGTGGMPIAHYNVFRGSSPSTLVQIAQATSTKYTDQTGQPGTTYYYAIQSIDSGVPNAQSGLSAAASVTTYPMPGVPTNVKAVGASTSRITVSWSAPAPNGGLAIANYRVLRSSSPTGTFAQIMTTTQTTYNDQKLPGSTTYYYEVEAVDKGVPADVGAPSAPVAGTTFGSPSAPSNVAANPASSTKITVTWSASVPNGSPIASYHVYGGPSCSSLTQLAVTTALTYNNNSLQPGTSYCYAVQAADKGGDLSPMSDTVTASTYPLPTAPSNVMATAKGKTAMSVTWSPSTGNLPIKYYYVSRGLAPGSLSQIATTTKTSFTDQNLTAGTTYYYSIQAGDSAGDRSPSSPPVAGTTNQ
ncbi:MAG TPA: fibronectin type III domain-containing protein [Bryobacteraceae bacterium]|nr:fibronectin type III domain-containing protein [Bryobacteraceae bacterium]